MILCLVIGLISLIFFYFGLNMELEFNQVNYNTSYKYEFYLKLKNSLYFFIPYVGVSYISRDKLIHKVLHMNFSETKKIKNKIVFQYRGVYDFSKFRLEVKDIMFIFTKYKRLKNNPIIRVYPRVWSIKEQEINKLNYIFRKSVNKYLIENDYLNVKDIRKYNYNDSYKKIHWKATSKTGQLYVKNYENFDKGKMKIFVDMNEEILNKGKDIEESYIEYVVSILNYIMDDHIEFEVHFANDIEKIIFSNGKASFDDIMEYLVDNSCVARQKLFDSIAAIKSLSKKDFFCIIVFEMNESVIDKIIQLKRNGTECSVFYFKENFEKKSDGKYLDALKIKCFSMSKLVRNG
ncbi:DUF58 domain-containing protein [Clostridium neuense]|uniref:DUF58 domain-containing protein n=1 Tax=Clostridium neuense TaxID=1728934 RepID=A0ABW8TDB8_9CLOT